jgi:hypothetical protein
LTVDGVDLKKASNEQNVFHDAGLFNIKISWMWVTKFLAVL